MFRKIPLIIVAILHGVPAMVKIGRRHQWNRICWPDRSGCHVIGETFELWIDRRGKVFGAPWFPEAVRVGLNHAILSWQLSDGGQFQLSAQHLYMLRQQGSYPTIEFADRIQTIPTTAQLSDAFTALGTFYGQSEAPQLRHFAAQQALRQFSPKQLVPHTKPQVEFAIRAQRGQ